VRVALFITCIGDAVRPTIFSSGPSATSNTELSPVEAPTPGAG